MNKITRFFLWPALAVISLLSCRHEFEKPRWDTRVVAPLIRSSMGIDKLLVDSLTQTNPDSSISIVYRSVLADISLDSLIDIPDTTMIKSVKLDSINMGTRTITYSVTLGQIAKQADPLTQALIYAAHGSTTSVPPFGPISSDTFHIDASSFFRTITLQEGYMDITLENGMPVDITDVIFRLTNMDTTDIIVLDTFPLIPAGGTVKKTESLAGKTLDSVMVGKILSMRSPGSNGNPVQVDTSDAIKATMFVYGLKPSAATAIFPAQDLINQTEQLPLKFPEAQLYYAKVKKGLIKIEAYSTLQDTMHFYYWIPSATLGGQEFYVYNKIPPAPPGGSSKFFKIYDFANYDLDLTGQNKDTINMIYHKLVGHIDSTGVMRTITLQDSFWVYVGFIDVSPSYAKGYLGSDSTEVGPDSIGIDVFNKLIGGTLDLEDVKISLNVDNGIGADGKVVINSISSVNTKKGTTVPLSGPGTTPITVQRATDNGWSASPQYKIMATNRTLDKSNSNAKALIENLPNRFDYSMKVYINPDGNTYAPLLNDFVYSTSTIKASLDMELPLSAITNQLTLVDSGDFSATSSGETENIASGVLTLIADNGFPYEAKIQVFLYDENYNLTDSLMAPPSDVIAAAPVDANNRVTVKKRSKILIPVDHEKLDRVLKAKRRVIRVSFTTQPANTYVKVFSDYSIDFVLTADFIYHVNGN